MSKAIFCLVFVAIVASIGHGRTIEVIDVTMPPITEIKAERSADYYENYDYTYDHGYDTYDHGYDTYDHGYDTYDYYGKKKRSPGFADFADKIDEAVDLKAIGGHIDTAIDEVEDFGSDVGDAFVDAGSAIEDFFGRKKRSPGVADLADQIDEAVDLKVIGGHIDTAIDAVEDFGSDAIDEIKDFANSDGVRRVGNKVVDVANDVGDAFVDAGSAIGDFFGGLGKRSAGEVLYYGDYVYYEVEGSDDDHYHEDSGNDPILAETFGYY